MTKVCALTEILITVKSVVDRGFVELGTLLMKVGKVMNKGVV